MWCNGIETNKAVFMQFVNRNLPLSHNLPGTGRICLLEVAELEEDRSRTMENIRHKIGVE